jgi:radical SAM protein with 4Fe4S-binding SPASM domain
MVVSQNNCEDIEAFYEMVLSLGAHPEYAFINRRGNGRDDWESKALDARKKLEILKRIDRLNLKHHLNVTLPFCTSDCPLSDPKTPMAIAIKTDGSIIPCQLLYHPKHTLGNMLYFNKKEVEEGFRRIAGMVTKRKETDYGCSLCLLRNHCKKGCMALADDMTDDPLSGDGDCEYRKIQILGYDIQKQIRR